MNYPNPTPIRVGRSGTLAGKPWRVAGRIVLGMEDAGETYYWNEYHLVGEDGQIATLVYEETETVAEWRLFTLFEPQTPLTLAEASAQRVGNTFDLDGTRMRVTLVDESRVYFIEGTAPEGLELGDVAHYFNAETAGRMIVVSWTGSEIEYYRGLNLPADAVATAFSLPKAQLSAARIYSSGKLPAVPWIAKGLPFVVPLIFVVALFKSCGTQFQFRLQSKPKPLPAPLAVDTSGILDGVNWTIGSHQVVEIAMTGRQYDRHEYTLHHQPGDNRLLVCESHAGDTRWIWYRPIKLPATLTPAQAGTLKVGDNLALEDTTVVVTELFQATVGPSPSAEALEKTPRLRYFCLNGQAATDVFLVRWNETEITLNQGRLLPDRLVLESFPKPKP
jgi:hypothetical protein